MSFLEHDRQKYEELAGVRGYGDFSPGERYAPVFRELAGSVGGSVLDAGCCTGKGGLALYRDGWGGFTVALCDYTAAHLVDDAKRLPFYLVRSLWDPGVIEQVGRYDYVYCCDVLEHIPREFTMLTVQNLARIAKRAVFFSISLLPDSFGAWVGRPLHETVESYVWWRDRLKEFGTLEDARDLVHTGLYFLRPH